MEFLKSCIKNSPYKLVPIGEMNEDDDLAKEIDEASRKVCIYMSIASYMQLMTIGII